MRSSGILCGDDYWMPSVKSAVDGFADNNELPLRFFRRINIILIFQK